MSIESGINPWLLSLNPFALTKKDDLKIKLEQQGLGGL